MQNYFKFREMMFKANSIFNFEGNLVQQRVPNCAIFIEGIMGKIYVKFLEFGCSFKYLSIISNDTHFNK